MNIREKILIVEDEKSIAHFISTILTANGYEAMRASNGAEAMSMISSHCPDLVILDLGRRCFLGQFHRPLHAIAKAGALCQDHLHRGAPPTCCPPRA